MSYERAKELFFKYKNEMATDEEKALVEKWLFGYNNEHSELSDEKIESISREVWSRLPQPVLSPIYRLTAWTKVAAAASIILGLSFGGYFLLHKQQAEQTVYFKNDILPGHNQATLTLANGQKIILTKGLTGQLAQQGNTLIVVNGQNTIAYTAAGTNANLPVAYNTLSTAIGEQSPYPLILADGTRVWLDAESAITFPVAFSGKDRTVKVSGEAYFEVAHNDAHPFKVLVKDQTIEDIGTHFNISAYDDEKVITTTLLEGAVKVSVPEAPGQGGQAGVLLKPGQQSVLKDDAFNVSNANIEETMAWKNGYFRFNNEKIESVMLKLSRWYNIDVKYEGAISDEKFYATSSRYRNISEVLTMLQKTNGVHFKIEGRRVTVMQ